MLCSLLIFRGDGHPNGDSEEIRLERKGTSWTVSRSKGVERLEVQPLPDGRLSLLFEDGRQVCGRVTKLEEGVRVTTRNGSRKLSLADPLRDRLTHTTGQAAPGAGEEEIRSLMPGRVVDVCVRNGDHVEAGALLLVLEAMKMQNEIRAAHAGVVQNCAVTSGHAVEGGALLLTVRSVLA